ncbi:Uncharacterised protein [Klebsiella pneumoniae]|nr:hypothetical protein [Erwinia aphidicola]VTT29017.1 Uncharacterised protein [Klebsiella pneumoniae]
MALRFSWEPLFKSSARLLNMKIYPHKVALTLACILFAALPWLPHLHNLTLTQFLPMGYSES